MRSKRTKGREKTMETAALVKVETAVVDAGQKTAALVEAFFQGMNGNTVRAYRQDLEDFRAFVEVETVDEAARLLLSGSHGDGNALGLRYRAALLERGLSPATVNRRLAALRSLVSLGRTLGLVSWELAVKNVRTSAYRDTRGPGLPGFRSMLETVGSRKDAKGRRDEAALRLLYDLGLRRGEVVSLDVEDVDLAGGTVAVLRKGKTEKRLLSLAEPTKAALRAWLEIRGTEAGPLFVNVDRAGKGKRLTGTSLYRIVRGLGEKVGLKTRPHGLRHTAITEAVKTAQAHGLGLEEVLDFSGHADVSTLMVYRDRERNVQGRISSLVAAAV
jgi:integrase/recombinase XerC